MINYELTTENSQESKKSTNKKQLKNSRGYYALALKIAVDFGGTIAIPAVIFALIGNYLDEKYGYRFLFTLLGLVLAALVSGKIIYKKAREYGKKYESLNKDNNT